MSSLLGRLGSAAAPTLLACDRGVRSRVDVGGAFGLSMDDEVFPVGRMGEELLRTGYSRQSVVAGMAGTARVISSAALIVVAVFMGFAPDPYLPGWLDRLRPATGLRRTPRRAAGLDRLPRTPVATGAVD